mmetsp:Transcript_17456/g.26901  ORF Transcript_17456/g.26901 Transcript_17456/m.26901 type:complete len:169 (+) Transcript_17456:2142-2648(+)
MLVFFGLFAVVSVALIPLAWIIGIVDKFKFMPPFESKQNRAINLYVFIPLGIPILLLDCISDLVYFWKNNFRTGLERIVITKDKSKISHATLREITNLCNRFSDNKIKSVGTKRLVKILRNKFKVKQHIQLLMFGQIIPEGGFRKQDSSHHRKSTFRSLKTADLKDKR